MVCPPDIFWTKRHRIRAFQIQTDRTKKIRAKNIKFEKSYSDLQNGKKSNFFPVIETPGQPIFKFQIS